MQTIVQKDTNISLYYIDDNKTVTVTAESTTISLDGTLERTIQDCTSSNVVLRTGVDAKSDWWGYKYKHDGSSWSANSDFKGLDNLKSDINNSVTTISVINTRPFTTSGTVQINNEKITYTGVDGTNLTGCTRGAASTSAADHKEGDPVKQI
tara:strand:+ start:3081 stop:3536 length:456 start_codon:yes stop_codon:yes gene_type:complete